MECVVDSERRKVMGGDEFYVVKVRGIGRCVSDREMSTEKGWKGLVV